MIKPHLKITELILLLLNKMFMKRDNSTIEDKI